jgi:hypothetical protein
LAVLERNYLDVYPYDKWTGKVGGEGERGGEEGRGKEEEVEGRKGVEGGGVEG